jgi:hypothetical protein
MSNSMLGKLAIGWQIVPANPDSSDTIMAGAGEQAIRRDLMQDADWQLRWD